jgi:ABC-2 type transport system ATP-binding protein
MTSPPHTSTSLTPAPTLYAVGHEQAGGRGSTSLIEVSELTKRFGDLVAVDHVSFTIEQGGIVGFLGPNGAGKTTTLRMLLGLTRPSEGTATIEGRPYTQLPSPPHAVGAALDSSGGHPGRTAHDHLRIHALASGAPASRVAEMLELVELTGAAERRIGEFSLGMRQRLGLATALLCDPEVLILDEPGNGLDPEGLRWLRGLLRGFASEGRTVLISSHVLAEVAQTADSVLIMNRGRLVAHAALDELIAAAGQRIEVRSPRAEELAEALVHQGASVRRLDSERLEIKGATGEQIGILAAERSIPIFETAPQFHDLEDVFLKLTTHTHETEQGTEVSA